MRALECALESRLPQRLASRMQEDNLANLVPPLILRLLGTSFTFQLTSVVKPLANCEEILWVVGTNLGTHVANNFLVIFC